nr:phosphatase PAP2 family protein [bacterium]
MQGIYFFQQFMNPVLTALMQGVTLLGEQVVLVLLAAYLMWCGDKKLGWRMALSLLTGVVAFTVLKEAFAIPRPWIRDPSITVIRQHTATGYSFPSGHTQNVALVGTLLCLQWGKRRRWLWGVMPIVAVLVGISRMYLGVHTLEDVVCGLVLGIAVGCILHGVTRHSTHSPYLMAALIALAALAMALCPVADLYKAGPMLMMVALGAMLEPRWHYDVRAGVGMQAAKMVVGIGILLALQGGLKVVFPKDNLYFTAIRYAAVGAWAALGMPVAIAHFNKRQGKGGAAWA